MFGLFVSVPVTRGHVHELAGALLIFIGFCFSILGLATPSTDVEMYLGFYAIAIILAVYGVYQIVLGAKMNGILFRHDRLVRQIQWEKENEEIEEYLKSQRAKHP